jgi:hypothetical protein
MAQVKAIVKPMQAQAQPCNGQGRASTSAAIAIVWAMLGADGAQADVRPVAGASIRQEATESSCYGPTP